MMLLSRLSSELLLVQVNIALLFQLIFHYSITWSHHSHTCTNNFTRNSHTMNNEYILALLICVQNALLHS